MCGVCVWRLQCSAVPLQSAASASSWSTRRHTFTVAFTADLSAYCALAVIVIALTVTVV